MLFPRHRNRTLWHWPTDRRVILFKLSVPFEPNIRNGIETWSVFISCVVVSYIIDAGFDCSFVEQSLKLAQELWHWQQNQTDSPVKRPPIYYLSSSLFLKTSWSNQCSRTHIPSSMPDILCFVFLLLLQSAWIEVDLGFVCFSLWSIKMIYSKK